MAKRGKARQDKARRGKARRGEARQGEAGRSKARQGEARETNGFPKTPHEALIHPVAARLDKRLGN